MKRKAEHGKLGPTGKGLQLAVIIPCLNEAETVARVLQRVPRKIEGIDRITCIVVDDGSSDQTAALAAKRGAKVLSHPRPLGVGAAFHTGVEAALRQGADLIVNIDGDGQFDSFDIGEIVRPLLVKEADFVTASRFVDPSFVPQMPAIKRWGNWGMAWLMTSLTRQKLYDVSCGFRAYTREAALNLNLMGQFTYTQETLLNLVFKGYRIKEVPVHVRGEREFGESRVARSVLRYAVKSIKIIFRSYRDYKPFLFFGSLSAWCFGFGLLLALFVARHYFQTGGFTEQLWAAFTGGALLFCGLILFVVATVADMLDRVRHNQEKILYLLREQYFRAPDGNVGGKEPGAS